MATGTALEDVDLELIADGLYNCAVWPHERPYVDANRLSLYIRQITILFGKKEADKLYSSEINSYFLAVQVSDLLVEIGVLGSFTANNTKYYTRTPDV